MRSYKIQEENSLWYSTAKLAISTLVPGTHTLTANYAGDAVLTAAPGGPITVMVADYTVQTQPTSLTLTGGQTGTSTISVIPLGGSTQTVSFTCANLPSNLTCAFAPATVTLDGVDPGSVKVTVSASVVAAAAVAKTRVWGVAILVLVLYAAGCGGGSTTTTTTKTPQTATYVGNVTASAGVGTTAKTFPLVVTVNN